MCVTDDGGGSTTTGADARRMEGELARGTKPRDKPPDGTDALDDVEKQASQLELVHQSQGWKLGGRTRNERP